MLQNRAEDPRRCHYHQHQQQSSSTSHLQRVGTSESPVTNRARDGGHPIRIRSGGNSGTGGVEHGTQVLQVVAINGYPVVTRNGKSSFSPSTVVQVKTYPYRIGERFLALSLSFDHVVKFSDSWPIVYEMKALPSIDVQGNPTFHSYRGKIVKMSTVGSGMDEETGANDSAQSLRVIYRTLTGRTGRVFNANHDESSSVQSFTASVRATLIAPGQEVFFAAAPRTLMNHHHNQQQHRYQYQHHQSSQQLQQAASTTHHSMPSGMYSLSGDQALVDHEGTVRRLSTAQRERLSQDLTVVQTNLHILNDMLTELQPDAISSDDLELLQELNETCRMMQQRVAEFLSQVADDAVTLTLIQLNDELNSAFQRYERFERYRLRAMRAQIANRDMGQSRPALPSTQMVPSQQLQLQPPPTAQQQQQQQPHHLHLGLPSTSGIPSHQKDDHERSGGGNGGGIDEDEDDDDDELLDAVAEQTQRNPHTTEVGDSGLVSVADWSDNALALQVLRLNDTSHTSWNTESSAAQLERVFGAGYNDLTILSTDASTALPNVQALPGPQLEPLQPQPAPLPPPPPPPPPPPLPPPSSKALPQLPIKKRTPSEVRRLEEALLLFDS
ncbi:unnamed protein product [Hydatigera taeniaeformis]|uniref:GAT domain-containing protein n=1 Tax=Hydatigena taeniaeformis TaxID=6205 RepID=A0A3P7FVG8_HYDTA|nr:unnamed protein product [Hydatigera taeniaeformis]